MVRFRPGHQNFETARDCGPFFVFRLPFRSRETADFPSIFMGFGRCYNPLIRRPSFHACSFCPRLESPLGPIAIRERVSFQPERWGQALLSLTRQSRCERLQSVDLQSYRTLLRQRRSAVGSRLARRFHRLSLNDISPYLYSYPQREAVRHVFRVASGLDSMVLGKPHPRSGEGGRQSG